VATELVMYPREPHGFREPKHRVDMLTRMVDWFGRICSLGSDRLPLGS